MSADIEKGKIYLEEEKPIIEFPTLVKIFMAFMALGAGLSLLFLPWYIALFLFIGLALTVAIFLNLYIGILIFLVGAFFHPTYWFPQLQALHLARNLAFGVLFLWGFHTIIYRDFRLVKAPQNIFMLLFFSLAFCTTFRAFDYTFSYFLEFSAKALVLYFAIANLIRKRQEIIFLVWFLVGISFISALVGIYQYIHGIGVYYAEEGIVRISGLAEDANVYAMDLAISLPMAIALFFCYEKPIVKIITAGIVSILIVTIILTYSRAGLIQLLSVLFFSVGIRIFQKRKLLGTLAFIAAMVIFLPLVPEKYIERAKTITQFSDPAIGKRLAGWKVGLGLISEHPFSGVGFGMFRYTFLLRAVTTEDTPYKQALDAHNLYIHTGAEMGIGGLLLLLVLLFLTLRDLRMVKKIFKEKNDFLLAEISSAVQISLLVYLLGGMFISYLQLLIFWIMLPIAVALKQLATE